MCCGHLVQPHCRLWVTRGKGSSEPACAIFSCSGAQLSICGHARCCAGSMLCRRRAQLVVCGQEGLCGCAFAAASPCLCTWQAAFVSRSASLVTSSTISHANLKPEPYLELQLVHCLLWLRLGNETLVLVAALLRLWSTVRVCVCVVVVCGVCAQWVALACNAWPHLAPVRLVAHVLFLVWLYALKQCNAGSWLPQAIVSCSPGGRGCQSG